MTPQRLTADEVAKAVYEAKGLASIAAKRLGCDPKTVRNFAQRYPTVRDAIVQAREDLKDFAESKLLQAIDAGEIVPILFFLKTQAKDRGYIERNELTGADGGPIQTQVFDHGNLAAAIATRSGGYRLPPSEDQDGGNGETLG
jgi:hypothetical protein